MSRKSEPSVPRKVWRMTPEMPMGAVVESVPPAADPTAADAGPPEASKKVLTAPKPPSWLTSSMDLLTGCNVSEDADTIPGALYDELFGDRESPDSSAASGED